MNESDIELKLKPIKQELSLFQLNALDKLGKLEAQLKSHSHPIAVDEVLAERLDSVIQAIFKVADRVKELEEVRSSLDVMYKAWLESSVEEGLKERRKSFWRFWK